MFNIIINILFWILKSTTALQVSSSVQEVISVSTLSTDVMGSSTAVIAQMSRTVVSAQSCMIRYRIVDIIESPVIWDCSLCDISLYISATRPPGMCHHESEFQCQSDGSCVPSTWECDGHPDCEDGSDEHHACLPRTCPSSFFRCDNGNCVLRSWLCDGDNDCRDMSDERDCPTPPFRCPSWQWQCPGHSVCINLTTVCDNTPDCPNGADESPLCSKSVLCFLHCSTCSISVWAWLFCFQ